MSKKSQKNKVHDPNIAALAGDSFYQHAKIFTQQLSKDINQANIEASRDFGGLISSATMQALSIELYLKSLRIFAKINVPNTHNLWKLYKDLPNGLKQSIENMYLEHTDTKGTQTAGLILQIKRKDDGWEDDENDKPANDFKSVLTRSKDAFINWRYIHEGTDENETLTYRYDYYQLGIIAQILRAHIQACSQLKGQNIDFKDLRLTKKQ